MSGSLRRLSDAFLGPSEERTDMPLQLLVVGDYRGRPHDGFLGDRPALEVDDRGFDALFRELEPRVHVVLSEWDLSVTLSFSRLADFDPEAIVRQLPVLRERLEAGCDIGPELDALLHHPDLQRLESAWRGLDFLVRRTDFRAHIRIRVLSCTKQELTEDLEDCRVPEQSGFFGHLISRGYCAGFPLPPVSVVLADYTFGPGPEDADLLRSLAYLCAESAAPLVAGADPSCLDLEDFSQLSGLRDVAAAQKHPRFAGWQSLRESDDVRFLGLALPRFLGRLPHGRAADTTSALAVGYEESIVEPARDLLWCNPAFAYGSVLTRAFARDGWCHRTTGQKHGAVKGLPTFAFESDGPPRGTEQLISERAELELSDCGLLPLVFERATGAAAFYSTSSLLKRKRFDRPEATTSYRAMTELHNVLLLGRIAQYLRGLAADSLAREPAQLEKRLGAWMAERPKLFAEGSSVRVLPPVGGRALQLELVVVPGPEVADAGPELRLRTRLE